jgi:drug/metabolite transporter (DMT)-like permease
MTMAAYTCQWVHGDDGGTHFYAIQQIEVAYMIAVKRTSLLFGMLYGVILFKEHTTWMQFVAGGIMVAGVFLIAI